MISQRGFFISHYQINRFCSDREWPASKLLVQDIRPLMSHWDICWFGSESLLSQKKILLNPAVWGWAEQDRTSYKSISLHLKRPKGHTLPTLLVILLQWLIILRVKKKKKKKKESFVPLEKQPSVSTSVVLKGFSQSARHSVFQSVCGPVCYAEVVVDSTIPISATSSNIADCPFVFGFPYFFKGLLGTDGHTP